MNPVPLHLADHLIAALLTLVVPWLVMADYRKLVRALGSGERNARTAAYRQTILVQWGFTAVVVGIWLWQGRSLPSLGLGLQVGWGLGLGLMSTVVACAFLVLQVVTVRRRPEARAAVRAQIGSLRPLLPHTRAEGRWFTAVSVTAGVCEEVVYRGFLMAYFGGLGVLAAMLLSTAVFGLSHAYMGRVGALRASSIALVVAGLYWLTGSLWAPMLLHAAADVTSGVMGRISFTSDPDELPPETAAHPQEEPTPPNP